MKLHFSPFSTNSRKVVATANHLQLTLELLSVDFAKSEQKAAPFVALNPNGAVPVLQDEGLVLWESVAITQYLCDKHGETSLWPKDLRERADINRWQLWGAVHFQPPLATFILEKFFKPLMGRGAPDAALLEAALPTAERYLSVLDRHLAGRSFLVGSTVSLADFSVAVPFGYTAAAELPVSAFKTIAAWTARLDAIEAWKISAPPLGAH